MALTDWVQTAAAIYFAWQQNRIFKQQNQIFANQSRRTAMPVDTSRLRSLKRYWPTVAMLALMLLTGYDIYDRHHSFETGAPEFTTSASLSEDKKKIYDHLAAVENRWATYPYEQIMGRHFENTTVLLDGREFSNCTFLNVTFQYEGTAPFLFNGTPEILGKAQIESDLPVVKDVFNIFINLGMIPEVRNTPLTTPNH